MAYTFTTLNAGDPISRDTVVANLDGIKVYAHKIETSALQAAQFVDTNHVMQPEYDPIRNVSTHVSGIYGGQNNGGVSLSFQFSTRWNSKVSDPKYRQPIPKTSLQIKMICISSGYSTLRRTKAYLPSLTAMETMDRIVQGLPNNIGQNISELW